ncbi:MAG: MFS transporter [Bacillota bacterium]
MQDGKPRVLSLPRQVLYASGSIAFTLLERMLILHAAFFYLPPEELGLPDLISTRTYGGIFTVLGVALLFGRLLDGLADPVIASLSDNSQSPLGRRKSFLLVSALPLSATSALVFFPPYFTMSVHNGLWLALVMGGFYIFFTAYVNPYLSLISELGHTDSIRVNLSTFMAFFGLAGVALVTVLFPVLLRNLQDTGLGFRQAYQAAAAGSAALCALVLYAATLAFDEKTHCLLARPPGLGIWQSFRRTLQVRPFRIFLMGEVFLQYAMNLVTLGLLYYTVVLFRREPHFLTVLSGITLGIALLSFPWVNILAKRLGKKRLITFAVQVLALTMLCLFVLSANLSGMAFYAGLALFGVAGVPLAILTILMNPTIAELARSDALRTGQHREAMFFGVRAIPLKLSIAAAGVTFGFLLSTFGKDVSSPAGVRLSLLLVSVSSALGYACFSRYPEKEVQDLLREH